VHHRRTRAHAADGPAPSRDSCQYSWQYSWKDSWQDSWQDSRQRGPPGGMGVQGWNSVRERRRFGE